VGRHHARRGRLNVAALYEPARAGGYPNINVPGLVSLAAGILAGWAWQYGLVPAMQGPVATALGNTDFSWLSGSAIAAGLYYALCASTAHRS
jgi:NCS1 family nucleobase:cation symporter-1